MIGRFALLLVSMLLAGHASGASYEVRISEPIGFSPGGAGGYIVNCPGLLISLGGGFDSENEDAMVGAVSRAIPKLGSTQIVGAWSPSIRNVTNTTQYAKLAVVCGAVDDVEVVTDTFPVPAGAIGSDSVLCPFGTVALGGGVVKQDATNANTKTIAALAPIFPANPLTRSLASRPVGENPAPGGWEAAFVSEGPAGTGEVDAICAPFDDVVTVVEQAVVAPGTTLAKNVVCPIGMEAVSGGVDASDRSGLRLASSGPLFLSGFPLKLTRIYEIGVSDPTGPLGWRIAMRNDAATPRTIKVAAICAPEPTGAATAAVATLAFAGAAARRRRPEAPLAASGRS